jgi:glycosyltransferase involved in cell wall biosynthesis
VIWVIKDTGVLVPPQNSEALAQALQQMVDNPQQRTDLGEAGKQRFEQVFDIKKVAEKISEVYYKAQKL